MKPSPSSIWYAHYSADQVITLLNLIDEHGYTDGVRISQGKTPLEQFDAEEWQRNRSVLIGTLMEHARTMAQHLAELYDGTEHDKVTA